MRRSRAAFADFYETCKTYINPELSQEAVEEMLTQHILTERIFRTVFERSDFTRRNIIAREIENVSDVLMRHAMSRDAFLEPLDRFYVAIEQGRRSAKISPRNSISSIRFMRSSFRDSLRMLRTTRHCLHTTTDRRFHGEKR